MSLHDDAIRSLREAIHISPDNVPLRRHLAQTLGAAGRWGEAVEEYRRALSVVPRDVGLQTELAEAYFRAGKTTEAFVVVESLLKGREATAAAHLLHSRLLLETGETDRAGHAYRQAVEVDPAIADPALAAALGLEAASGRPETDDEDEVDEQGRIRLSAVGGRESDPLARLERPTITFADVGGMEALKEEIRMKILHPIHHPELYRAYGKPIGGGILMFGPPGCGKTYLARATAGEVQAAFIAVGIEDVLEMWLGNSERNLHALFETARRHAPCVLFFDEVDALGANRSDMRASAGKQLINQFLAELDGVKHSNEGVLVLGATNAPWHLDGAFRRPGRFDRVLFVPPPDRAARVEILKVLLRDRPCGALDLEAVAAKCERFSGADLKAVVDLAIEAKLHEAIKLGRPVPLATKDLQAAAKKHKATTGEWFATARNYAVYSNQGGVYDDVLQWLNIK